VVEQGAGEGGKETIMITQPPKWAKGGGKNAGAVCKLFLTLEIVESPGKRKAGSELE